MFGLNWTPSYNARILEECAVRLATAGTTTSNKKATMHKPSFFTALRRPTSLALGLTLICLSTAATAGATLDHIRATGKIVLGYRESSVPFSYLDGEKRPVGYALDLCLKLADVIKKKLDMKTLAVEYVMVTPSNRIGMVEQGKVDMECGSTTNNAERRKKVAFTVPHYITGARYMVRADEAATDIVGLESKRVVSTKGTTPIKAVERINRDRGLHLVLQEAPDHARAVEMVEKGESDAFVMDDVLLYGLIAGRANPEKLKVIGKFLTVEPLAIMLPKGDPEMKAILDNEMKRMIVSKEAQAIYDHWFMKPIPPKNTPLNLPMNYLLRDFWKYPTDQVPG
jgi:ABC-type amino acid transport substrate-binding protein